MVRRKYLIFLEAFLVAVFIFTFGILMGVFIENARVNQSQQNFAQLETEILDARLISSLISSADCNVAISENIKFADRVFWEARELDKYEQSSEITDSIKEQHKKYDLLRAMIWVNSIEVRERCNSSYHNIVYVYEYEKPSINKRAEQTVISNILMDLKTEKGDNILLISMAGDMNSPSIELLKEKYNVTQLPTILIDEKYKIIDINSLKEAEKYLT